MNAPASQRRRAFMTLTAAVAASGMAACTAGNSPRGTRLPFSPFGLGVASGSPAPDGFVLWTRLVAPGNAPLTGFVGPTRAVEVAWEVADDEAFARVVQRGVAIAPPELAHAVHVQVRGLTPERPYFYRFISGDAASPVGRTRTLPPPDAAIARLRLAYASCQRFEHGFFSAYRHMRDDAPDCVLFLGDYIYEYPGAQNAVRNVDGVWTMTLDDYRRRYAIYKGDADLKAMHAAAPWIITWDDHEVQNDYAGTREGNAGPVADDFVARRAAAYQAWFEHLPVPPAALKHAAAGLMQGEELRVYGHFRVGRLADIALLDTRQYRDPQACSKSGRTLTATAEPAACAEWNDPARSLLGIEQERWLERVYGASSARWNVLAQQCMFGERNLSPGRTRTLLRDPWDGYPAARRRVTDAWQRHRVANPVVLGGDAHENWVGQVKADYADPSSRDVGVEFCGTSISSREFDRRQTKAQLAANPHFIFADSARRGYGLAEFTRDRLNVQLRVVDDVARRDTGVSTLARFEVEAGRSRVTGQ
ncbi:MAG: alkaline phosphatase D family protein [Burkholderiales bacterium]|nr:alkaline phosphatase D family protein [Burkholderiales bacterium]